MYNEGFIGLDFETYSACNLKVHGLDRYVSHPTFTPLIGTTYAKDKMRYDEFIGKYDFVLQDRHSLYRRLAQQIGDRYIVAQNAGFEQAVLHQMGLVYPSKRFVDSAVVARAVGAGSSLEACAPQLLGVDKMEEGKELIKLFCIPGPYQETHETEHFVADIVLAHREEWARFMQYCVVDSKLGYRIATQFLPQLTDREMLFQAITMDMNKEGWHVDVPLVEEMHRRYLENVVHAEQMFRQRHNEPELNFNSPKQVSDWCAKRGIKSKSFDKQKVDSMVKRLESKLDTMSTADPKWAGYDEVLDMLRTKQIIGGSSLKKLKVILDTVGADGQLRDQYMHVGAGQTWRTTGRSVQMQNLKRIGDHPDDVELLHHPGIQWDNEQLAKNIRQLFTSSTDNGRLLVGDFKQVEARGLAWWAGEEWKNRAFRNNEDLYLVSASRMFGVDITDKSDPRRQTGKVSELGCGYGIGPDALQGFAATIGVELSEGEAAKIVVDWRAANPKIVELWSVLDLMLHRVMAGSQVEKWDGPDGFILRIARGSTPDSLLRQAGPGVQSLVLEVIAPDGSFYLRRWFHGCYRAGRNVRYYRPTDRKTGDLWKDWYVDPKTGQSRSYEIYGGKLSGILTQSFCRELFMRSLQQVHKWTRYFGNLTLIGQFHDEIVVDWYPDPGGLNLERSKREFEMLMSDPGPATSFPLAADIKDDFRYTK